MSRLCEELADWSCAWTSLYLRPCFSRNLSAEQLEVHRGTLERLSTHVCHQEIHGLALPRSTCRCHVPEMPSEALPLATFERPVGASAPRFLHKRRTRA